MLDLKLPVRRGRLTSEPPNLNWMDLLRECDRPSASPIEGLDVPAFLSGDDDAEPRPVPNGKLGEGGADGMSVGGTILPNKEHEGKGRRRKSGAVYIN